MSPLWRKALPTPTREERAREAVVKSSLTSNFGQAIKSMHQTNIHNSEGDEPIQAGEAVSTIVHILEAIFIHGLKDTFVNRVSSILSGNVDKVPEPNFWPFLLVFTHKNVICQITHLGHVYTDIGKCRAWVRIALNDGLIESYLSAMMKDKSSLRYYYGDTAYLRDGEQPDIARKFLEGLAALNFQLPYNSKSLNHWTSTPLMLAGVWAPPRPLAPEPVITGIDIANFCTVEDSPSTSRRRQNNVVSQESGGAVSVDAGHSLGTEDDMQFLILRPDYLDIKNQFRPQDSVCSSLSSCPDPPIAQLGPSDENATVAKDEKSSFFNRDLDDNNYIEETPVQDYLPILSDDVNENMHSFEDDSCNSSLSGNHDQKRNESSAKFASCRILNKKTQSTSINVRMSRQIAEGVAEAETGDDLEKQNPSLGNGLFRRSGWSSSFDDENCEKISHPNNPESYNALLQNYSPIMGSIIRTPNFNDVLDSLASHDHELTDEHQPAQPQIVKSPDDFADSMDFEIVPRSCVVTNDASDARMQELLDVIGEIGNEKGLDAQNFQCKACCRPIGMIYGRARVCTYDGFSYCYECHDNDEHTIPAKIIHNWDFKKYKIAKGTKQFLELVDEEPILEIRKLNSSLYTAVEEMNDIMTLRTQLSYLRSYLFTCRESVAQELRKRVWPKEYLIEHIHLYSPSDLLQVPNGNLANALRKVINFALKHVQECRLCSQKGFICEICNNPKVIYPFQLDITFRCDECLAVYHNRCMVDKKPCPKCDRRKKRQDQVDYMWSVNDAELQA